MSTVPPLARCLRRAAPEDPAAPARHARDARPVARRASTTRRRARRSTPCSTTSATSSRPATSGLHRAFLHTFLAMRAAEAQGPAAVLAMLVAIGDTAAQVAQESRRRHDRGRRADAAADARHREHRARGERPDRRGARRRVAQWRELAAASGRRGIEAGRVNERAATQPMLRVAGDTNVGKVRTTNEDSMIVDPARGLYVVLDGMGGANAGDVASQTARDAIREFVASSGDDDGAAAAARGRRSSTRCAAVYQRGAGRARERHGMGTTCVACLVVDRAARDRRARRRLPRVPAAQRPPADRSRATTRSSRSSSTAACCRADEAERHPYKNVLSRNLGARPRRASTARPRAQAGRPADAVQRRAVRLRVGRGDPVPARLGRRARARRARPDRARAARRRRRQRDDDRDRGAAPPRRRRRRSCARAARSRGGSTASGSCRSRRSAG